MALERIGFSVPLTAASDLSEKQYYAVKCSDNFKCDVASDGSEAIGVLINNPKSGMSGSVMTNGVVKLYVPEGVSVTAGKGVAISNGAAAGEGNFGLCLESVTGAGFTTLLLGVSGAGAPEFSITPEIISIAQTDSTGVDVAYANNAGTVTAVSTNAKVIATVDSDNNKVVITTAAADKGSYIIEIKDTDSDSNVVSRYLTVVVNA